MNIEERIGLLTGGEMIIV